MKTSIIIVLLTGMGVMANAQDTTYRITVTVTSIHRVTGNLEVALYNDPETFPKDNREYRTRTIPVRETTATCYFDVPAGDYALALYHDENGNGKCDKNLLRVPKEPFAFSNNIRPKLRAPSFASCKFLVDDDRQITIRLDYY